jgi:hypothetical protein
MGGNWLLFRSIAHADFRQLFPNVIRARSVCSSCSSRMML